MTRNKRKISVQLIETGEMFNTRVIAEIVANKIKRGVNAHDERY